MKFTEKEAFDELKRQLKSLVGEPAINDKAINESIATLMPLVANDEMELTDFVTKILPVLKTGDGNARKYASNAVKKREKELEDAAKGETKPAEGGEPKPQGELAELMKRIENLENEKKENERKANVATKRGELEKALADKGVKDSSWIKDFLSEVNVAEDTDVEATAEKYLKLYNRSHAKTPPYVTPQGTSGGGDNKSPFADVSESMKARAEYERANVIN